MKSTCILLFLWIVSQVQILSANEKTLTIVHTNDLHSHFLGFSPNLDYTQDVLLDDSTTGGWARIATVIKKVRAHGDGPVLVLDAGDFMMGSLFHMLSREYAFELTLMKSMGYDAVALGNHEFDLKPEGLAQVLAAAEKNNGLPGMVLANAKFSEDSTSDDGLEELFNGGIVKPYRIFNRGGVRIGVFGVMGLDAAEKAPFAAPVSFSDPIACAREMVDTLRNREGVDVVICLSHGGLSSDPARSEDELLALEVPGIDAVVGGHSHTRKDSAIIVENTPVVQAWSYGREVGILKLSLSDEKTGFKSWEKVRIDDSIVSDPKVLAKVKEFEQKLESQVLSKLGVTLRQVVARTDFDLTLEAGESNLGNFLADSVRWSVNRYVKNPVDVAIISNGVIRDPVLKGKTGGIAACDLFRAIPLGIGMDGSMGYPLVSFYIYPDDLKKGLEILTSIAPLKGNDYFLQLSGLKVTYNPKRMIFDRVTGVWMGDDQNGYKPLDYSKKNRRLIRVAADIYNATFLKIIGSFTWDILNIVPRDSQGDPALDLVALRVDGDDAQNGVQELKEWRAPFDYLNSFEVAEGAMVPVIPEIYRGKRGRIVSEPSLNPYRLLKGGSWVTWCAFLSVLIVISLLILGIGGVVAKIRG